MNLLKTMFLLLCSLSINNVKATDYIEGNGQDSAKRYALAQIFNMPGNRFDGSIVTFDKETGTAEKFYVEAYQDFNNANANFVVEVSPIFINQYESKFANAWMHMEESLYRASVGELIVDGVTSPAGNYSSLSSIYLFTRSSADQAIFSDAVEADAQKIINDNIKKSNRVLIKYSLNAEQRIRVPLRDTGGRIIGHITLTMKVVQGQVQVSIIKIEDHLRNSLTDIRSTSVFTVDANTNMVDFEMFLNAYGFTMGAAGGGYSSGRVTIRDCESKRCEEDKQ